MAKNPLSFLDDALVGQRREGLTRRLRDLAGAPGTTVRVGGKSALLLCSNNYLGLAGDARLKSAAIEATKTFGCGATGSRLISGNLSPYAELEGELARFKGTEASLVFTSGYQANIGAVPALAGDGDVILSDAMNHASLIDGCRLSHAETRVYRHGDVEDLERKLAATRGARRRLILTESVFSMDGDLAPLAEIVELARKYDAMLMVDESHGTGVFGATGAGLVQELGLTDKVDVQMGTFSKALGSLGGYIAGSRSLIQFLLQQARSFIFTTGLPPGVVAASRAAIEVVRQEPERRNMLWRNVALLRTGLSRLGFRVDESKRQIIPIVIGDAQQTMAVCRFLLRNGVFVQGIRPPTVPAGTSRLRLTPTAAHTIEEIEQALVVFAKLRNVLDAREANAAAAIAPGMF